MQKIAVVSLVVFGSFFCCLYDPTSAAPEKNVDDTIMDEILDVMRQYRLHNGDDTDTITETTTPPPSEDVAKMESDLNTCPNVDLTLGDSMIAKCTEVTYECVNKSHVLVVGGGVCLNVNKTTRGCSNAGWDPTDEPYCSPVCTVEEEVGRTWTIQMPGSRLIGRNQVLPDSVVVFNCTVGNLVGKKHLKCLPDGNFDADFPVCTEIKFNVTECGGDEWVRLYRMNMASSIPSERECPDSWIKASNEDGSIIGCHSRIVGECSPFFIEVGSMKFNSVCAKAVGYQMGFPDAYAVNALPHTADSLYVDGLSITYGFPRTHIWTYAVSSSRDKIYETYVPTCPCGDNGGQPPPVFVGRHQYCDSGHGTAPSPQPLANIQQNDYTVFADIKNDTSLWGDGCVCCNYGGRRAITTPIEDVDPNVKPPWFARHKLDRLNTERTTHFDIRLCEHEIDMQEGALITEFELYIKYTETP